MSDGRIEKFLKLAGKLIADEKNPTVVAQSIDMILETEIGRELFGEAVGLKLTSHPELTQRALVALAIPSYKQMHPRSMQAVHRLISFSRQFCDVAQSPVLGSCVIHWARNQLIAEIVKGDQPWTHVLFIDDDIVPSEDALVKMLRHDKDIVGALCTRRTDPPLPNARVFVEETGNFAQLYMWEKEQLIEAPVGTGMMLISRKAIERIRDYWLNCEYEQNVLKADPAVIEEWKKVRADHYQKTSDAFWFQFLPHLKGRGEYGEDISFCLKAMQCGFTVYTDASIKPGHMGDYEYSIEDYEAVQPREVQKAIAEGQLKVERIIKVED